jgi:recombination protein RecT
MNTQQVTTAPQGPKAVIEQFRRDLEKMGPQFAYALPAHIPLERFNRCIMTALQNSPSLFKCTRQSLFNAAMKAAADGLLPDGREGAIVPFSENEDGRKSGDQAAWMPMVAGIRKKARNSGELSDLYAHVVHEGDAFEYQLGDDPHIHHRPSLRGGRGRKIIAAYSIAVFKDGTKAYEIMSIEEIEDIRKRYSKSKRGPWSDPIAYPEMCRKTVVRLHCKSLPMSTDLDDVVRRDDELYDLKGAAERGKQVTKRQPASAMAALEKWAGSSTSDSEGDPPPPSADDPGDPQPGDDTVIEHDADTGEASRADPELTVGALIGMAQKQPPKDPEVFRMLTRQIIEAAKRSGGKASGDMLAWWSGPNARSLRNAAGMTADDTAALSAEVKAAFDEMN